MAPSKLKLGAITINTNLHMYTSCNQHWNRMHHKNYRKFDMRGHTMCMVSLLLHMLFLNHIPCRQYNNRLANRTHSLGILRLEIFS